eukprot:Seg1124.2 transcript_id=Seg1124.2/GoldUCD/mRNA.D3Y31 product="hypothetical protein" protein_id=Seg1124.2/GoldUCD/D3Y31
MMNPTSIASNQILSSNDTISDKIFKHCYNALAWRIILTKAQSFTAGVCIALVIIPTILTNGSLLIGLMKTKQRKLSCIIYIKMTAIFGCLSGTTGFLMYVLLFTIFHDRRACTFERASLFMAQVNSHVLGYLILVLAIDRYFNVRPNLRQRTGVIKWILSANGSYALVTLAIILSLLHGLVTVEFFGTAKSNIGKLIMTIFNVVIAVSVYIAYLRLYFELRTHERSVKNLRSAQSSSAKVKRGSKYLHEFVKTIAVILVAGMLCYLPFITMDIWTGWYTLVRKVAAPRDVRFVYYLSVIPVFINSSINAVLLLYRNEKALKYVKRCLGCSNHTRANSVECTSTKISRERTLGATGCKSDATRAHSNEMGTKQSITKQSQRPTRKVCGLNSQGESHTPKVGQIQQCKEDTLESLETEAL